MRVSTILLWLGLSSNAATWARVVPAAATITPAPSVEQVELRRRQVSGVDLASVLPILATAVPPSILALALTNVPAVSRLLWSEFLDDNTPSWFTALPTDVQSYLSGEFGPTTTVSATTTSERSSSATSSRSTGPPTATATANESTEESSDDHHNGLPLWAKILIGVLVPLVILGLLALLLCCCLRRRRNRRATRKSEESRAPTPAFISSSYRRGDPPGEQHVPLRGGHLSTSDRTSDPSHPYWSSTSNSGEFHTPIGGPSYEDIPPPIVAGGKHSRRSSRQSLSSLHSVPELPENAHGSSRHPAQNHKHILGAMATPHPPPPRSPRRSQSREFSSYDFNPDGSVMAPNAKKERRISPLNPAYSAATNEGYGNSTYISSNGRHYGAPGPYENDYVPYHGTRQDPELFMTPSNPHGGYIEPVESEWPLVSHHENGHIRRKPIGG